jgi:hypothetical protein
LALSVGLPVGRHLVVQHSIGPIHCVMTRLRSMPCERGGAAALAGGDAIAPVGKHLQRAAVR